MHLVTHFSYKDSIQSAKKKQHAYQLKVWDQYIKFSKQFLTPELLLRHLSALVFLQIPMWLDILSSNKY